MFTIEAYLVRLKKMQADFPADALAHPVRGDAFEYGQATGVVKGLAMASGLIEKMLEEEETNERKLEAKFGR